MQLERGARQHYAMHANWLYAVKRQVRLAQDMEEAQREIDDLATTLAQLALDFNKDIARAKTEVQGNVLPTWKESANSIGNSSSNQPIAAQ